MKAIDHAMWPDEEKNIRKRHHFFSLFFLDATSISIRGCVHQSVPYFSESSQIAILSDQKLVIALDKESGPR